MKIAVIADIHGNCRALEAVLDDIDGRGIDQIFSLGDNVGYGPEPEEVVQALVAREVFSVMGNHELGLVSTSYRNRLNPVSGESLDITKKLLSPASLELLAALPATFVQYGARFVHGCPPESITRYLFDPTDSSLKRVFSSYSELICFAGHTHMLQCFARSDDEVATIELGLGQFPIDAHKRYLTIPGSVGQPRDGINSKAKYLIWDLDQHTFEIRALAYDVETTIKLINDRGFPRSNGQRLRW